MRTNGIDDDGGGGGDTWQDEPDYADGRRRTRTIPNHPRNNRRPRYSVHVEYPTQPGHRGLISRSKDGKFVLDNSSEEYDDDEGGFDLNLPANRYRTRSVAIVAGYTPERLYSNVPSGPHRVVESGVYKVGGTDRPEPIYWQQLVFGSEGSTLPHRPRQQQQQHGSRQVGRLQEEDLRRLRELQPQQQQQSTASLQQQSTASLIQTNNLELRRTESQPKLRASSPLDQQVPLTAWMSPIHNYSDVSSVSHRERSIPSTLLTTKTTMSSLSSPSNFTSSQNEQSTRSVRDAIHQC
jgi:hypothetical protein